jgi:hypothetical protein
LGFASKAGKQISSYQKAFKQKTSFLDPILNPILNPIEDFVNSPASLVVGGGGFGAQLPKVLGGMNAARVAGATNLVEEGVNAANSIKPAAGLKPAYVPSYASGGIEKISHFLPQSTVMGYIENAPQANGGVTIPDPVTTLTRNVRTAAGGGMKDLELYNTDSLNYFRNMSSTVMTNAADGGVFDMFNKPKGLSIKGAQAGFTGMGKSGFDAIMGGDKFKLGSFKPQILGRGAYSAPTAKGAQRYAGSQGSLGGRQTPGGVVKSIVPGGARRINFLEPQAAVKPTTFDKGKILADKLLGGTYSKSPLANKLRNQLLSGSASVGKDVLKIGKLGGKLLGAAGPILDLAFPEPTAQYDQISGPNSFRNNPAYQKLETTQGNLTSKTNNTPTVVPLPPEYIKIPGRKSNKEKDMSTLAPPPGVKDMPSSIFRKDIGVYK